MSQSEEGLYDNFDKSELYELLQQRDQLIVALKGTSAEDNLTSSKTPSLPQDNGLHFLDFAGEIRNEVYKLVADYMIEKTDSRALWAIYSSPEWDWEKDQRLTVLGNPHLIILQPGLFMTCKQIRTEGLPFFFRRRKFNLPLNHAKRILDLYYKQAGFSEWFSTIGVVGQQNIRHLTLRNTPPMKGVDFVERIHRKLCDKATVIYQAGKSFSDRHGYVSSLNARLFARSLWNLAAKYQSKNPKKVPISSNNTGRKNRTFDREPDPNELHEFELIFKAGAGWFGMALGGKAQLWCSSNKRIEKWNEEWLASSFWDKLDMMQKTKKAGPRKKRDVFRY